MPDRSQFGGKYMLVSQQSDEMDEVLKFQGVPWLILKGLKHASKAKSITVGNDFVTDDVSAAGLVHVVTKCPIVLSEDSRETRIEKGLPNKMMNHDVVASCWWEGDSLVTFNHEPKTGLDMMVTHVLSENATTLTCTIKAAKGGVSKEGVEVFKRV
mmetsp:Transcript_4849/g.9850  ORF Transcript_4849/g.9850 Transcript_4849/m.9850 type:complete len:156 (+) Transcript_4849:100-567(+)|eukprot:CAMPEP_0196743056 /NCGR_PEP_ID=MMETSP1091-20130531/50452_1 /TAXON_ID=302021 /ORGANISM="Rhodomonas sp., Strain CCMP768" /LENGTH=155 /DNA_ID=CAMNT_0042089295 /DNA_START=100 /DNA_END=567 /DNA_ORIENTATION=+